MTQTADSKRQYLVFSIAGQFFAFDILYTREVVSVPPITPIPDTPGYIAGILNLRGTALPVIDMHRKLGMKAFHETANSAVVIVDSSQGEDNTYTGILVDAIRGVTTFESDMIAPPPKIGVISDLGILGGVAQIDDDFVLLLKPEKLCEIPILSQENTITTFNCNDDSLSFAKENHDTHRVQP